MSATLYLAPTTETVLGHIVAFTRDYCRARPLAPVTFLLPSGDAVRQLRRSLGDAVAVRPLQFYSLSAAILTGSGSATREMSDLATRRLVRGLLARLDRRGELTTFRPMLDKPGFIEVLVEWLREMKTQGVAPVEVTALAEAGNARDRQLAALYTHYQEALRKADCADADGLLWLAAEALERDRGLLAGAGHLVVAGFDQFSPVQLRMIVALAQRLPVTVYLLWDAARSLDSLALARLAPARRALREALRPDEIALAGAAPCGPALEHLGAHLFEAGGATVADEARCIAAVSAPSPEAEARYALRRVKQLLLDGVREEQIALLAPHPSAYRSVLAAVSREYGVPVAVETTLGENPCVSALLALLDLAPSFPWRQTFDALRSPYVAQPWLDAEQVALLDTLTRERPVIAGREQWLYALAKPVGETGDDAVEDDDRAGLPLLARLPADTVAALRTGLESFFDHVTPPAGASPTGYVAWLQDALLGIRDDAEEAPEADRTLATSLRMAKAAEQGEWAQRDARALAALLKALRDWLDAGELIREMRLAVAAAEQGRELLEWLPSVPVPPDPTRAAVRFGPLEISRAVTVDHLFVFGLSEGEFPRLPQPDALYSARERAAHPLPLVRMDSGEDASLWWQVLRNCQCSLTLLRSRIDANGADWLPSAYWEAVVRLIDGLSGRVEKLRVQARPAVAEAACASELLEALACGAAAVAPPAALEASWRAVMAARLVEEERTSWRAPAEHEGVVRHAAIGEDLRRRYGPDCSWSVSRLNRYGACPYAFWAQEALVLEAAADPDEGINAQQRGSLVHEVLEILFARLAAAGVAPRAETAEAIAGLLDEVCDEVLPRAAERYGFRPGPLWEREQRELRNELQVYLAWECEPAQARAFSPYRQELKFGLGRGSDGYGGVAITGLEGASITLRGVIDRIDRDDSGRLRVIDYKTGSKEFSAKDIGAGRALQSALYARAMLELMPEAGAVVETAYRHTGSRKQSGVIRCDGDEGRLLIDQAAAVAVRFARAAGDGWFAPLPSRGGGGRACSETCDFLGLCRVTRHGTRKAQRHTAPLIATSPGEEEADAGGGS